MCAKSLQSCLTLCDLMDCSPPGSPVHGILQARKLEWVAMSFSRESSADPALQTDSLPPRTLIDNKMPCSKEVAPMYSSIYSICVFPLGH